MVTKDYYLSISNKQASFAGDFSSNICYDNLNLNHNNEHLSKVIKSSKSFITDSRKEDNYDFTTDSQKNREGYFRDKLMKGLPSNFLEQVHPEPKEFGYKEKNSSKSNSSTLSLHIAAYEKSVKGISDPNNSNENVVIKKDKEQKELIKKLKSTKQLLKDSTSNTKNSFEYPRQQKEENDAIDPEVMQFKASQQLANPNQSTTNSGLPGIAKTMEPNQTERAEIDAMPTAIEKSPTPSPVPIASSSLQPTSAHPHPNEVKIAVLTAKLVAARRRTAIALHTNAELAAVIQSFAPQTPVSPTPIPPLSHPPRAPYANDIDEIAALEAELKEELERGDIAISDEAKLFTILENISNQLPPKPQKNVFTYFK